MRSHLLGFVLWIFACDSADPGERQRHGAPRAEDSTTSAVTEQDEGVTQSDTRATVHSPNTALTTGTGTGANSTSTSPATQATTLVESPTPVPTASTSAGTNAAPASPTTAPVVAPPPSNRRTIYEVMILVGAATGVELHYAYVGSEAEEAALIAGSTYGGSGFPPPGTQSIRRHQRIEVYADPSAGRHALFGCTQGADSFLSLASNCEGVGAGNPLGYASDGRTGEMPAEMHRCFGPDMSSNATHMITLSDPQAANPYDCAYLVTTGWVGTYDGALGWGRPVP